LDLLNFFFPALQLETVKDLIIFGSALIFDIIVLVVVLRSIIDIMKNFTTGRFMK